MIRLFCIGLIFAMLLLGCKTTGSDLGGDVTGTSGFSSTPEKFGAETAEEVNGMTGGMTTGD
jgi:hypothetical protein